MKVSVQIRLLPTRSQEEALAATLAACNEAANLVSDLAWERRAFRRIDLQKAVYAEVKALGLSAQPALHVIRKVADAYAGDRRRRRRFRAGAAQPYDDRCLSWQYEARTVSVWTVRGRVKRLAYTGSAEQLAQVAAYRLGESDLVCRDGMWFLHVTCEVPEAPLNREPDGFIGVDLGVVNIATTDDGHRYAGQRLNRYRERQRRLRRRLQAKGTGSAKRLLRKRRRKERRTSTHENHRIAKCIVAEAEGTGRGIALEDLQGLRERVRLRKPQRVALHSWSFHQLREFITYKARRAGVVVVCVDPAYTSQVCSWCGHCDKRNRLDQATFECRSCGVVAHADRNAARNIAERGVSCWAAVGQPYAA
ncbi:RNA-guided endonuclease InsQ/TnpB family protein [Actinomadura kijaniata]|uniref:RNA-guided endonuclease InsQ/TnpB family protein n=1 Tax=Actinomadura kijaniata TaxID=46161 RepID=UPI003F1C5BE3